MAGYDDYFASISIWAGNFNPRGWLFCQGQLLPISQYNVLFSLIGTVYGGNGTTNFQLPDLRGRVPVGAGKISETKFFSLGQQAGVESVTLDILQIPHHNHSATFTPSDGSSFSGTVALPVKTGLGAGGNNPNGKYLGGSGNINLYYDAPTDGSKLASANISISGTVGGGNVTIKNNGSSKPFDILQPYLALNFIICNEGLYPPRP